MMLRVGDRAPAVVLEALDGSRLECQLPGGLAVVSFTRYAGCPVCQLHVGRIAAAMPEFRARSCAVWMVFQSAPALLQAAMAEWRPGFMAVADPGAGLYDAFGVSTNLAGYIRPQSMASLVRAMLAGRRHHRFEGRETQMPADFVIDPTGRIILAHVGRSVGDDVPVATLLEAIDSASQLDLIGHARRPSPGAHGVG